MRIKCGVVEFHHAVHFLVIAQAHAHRNVIVNQMTKIFHLFEGLIGSFCLADFSGHGRRLRDYITIIAAARGGPQIRAFHIHLHGGNRGASLGRSFG